MISCRKLMLQLSEVLSISSCFRNNKPDSCFIILIRLLMHIEHTVICCSSLRRHRLCSILHLNRNLRALICRFLINPRRRVEFRPFLRAEIRPQTRNALFRPYRLSLVLRRQLMPPVARRLVLVPLLNSVANRFCRLEAH